MVDPSLRHRLLYLLYEDNWTHAMVNLNEIMAVDEAIISVVQVPWIRHKSDPKRVERSDDNTSGRPYGGGTRFERAHRSSANNYPILELAPQGLLTFYVFICFTSFQ